jgi:hypothetical protein
MWTFKQLCVMIVCWIVLSAVAEAGAKQQRVKAKHYESVSPCLAECTKRSCHAIQTAYAGVRLAEMPGTALVLHTGSSTQGKAAARFFWGILPGYSRLTLADSTLD